MNKILQYPFKASSNIRDLGGYQNKDGKTVKTGLLIRGIAPSRFTTAEDIQKFNSLKIETIFDLRSKNESLNDPLPEVFGKCRFINSSGMIYEDGEDVDFSPKGIARIRNYQQHLEMVEYPIISSNSLKELYTLMFFNKRTYGRLFDVLLNREVPLYFHCAAGKDRTGIAAILILLALGVSEEDAIGDYLYSNVCLKKYIDQRIAEHQEAIAKDPLVEDILREVHGVSQEVIAYSLNKVKERYHDYNCYLKEVFDLDETKISRLKELYTE